uniref:non-specific serine/threonine protein kinase n=1 Tax=Araucaria cunninghamii TaxID=56994 RepID=A0A0D6QVI5_ARACU
MAMAIALAASPLLRHFSMIYLLILLMTSAGAQQQSRKQRFILGSAVNDACLNGIYQNSSGCTCLAGFDYVERDDPLKGCRWNASQQICGASSVMQDIGDPDWPGNDYEQITPVNKTACKQACVEDCQCIVAIYGILADGQGSCWKKAMPLKNGRTDTERSAFVKVVPQPPPSSEPPPSSQPPPPSEPPKQSKEGKGKLLAAIGIALLFCSSLFAAISLIIWLRGARLRPKEQHKFVQGLQTFSYKELEAVTEGFKEKLGRGGFGTVYKGKLSDGKAVAVKKLKKAQEEGEKEFRTEMSSVGASHHKNLVRLYGFCDEGCHRLLVYEFMSNGSLDRALFQSESYLDWQLRVQIALGTAKGLLYLHEECMTQILHCDIKPQNILLDNFYTAKISDFGMAKLMGAEKTRTYTVARGTMGYIAPEWQRNAAITPKVDVYSFGVMLLEIICCRPVLKLDVPDNEIALPDWVYDCLRTGSLLKLVEHQSNCDSEIDSKELERMVLVGLWCIQEDPALRPSIKKVVQMLEGTVEIGVPPPPAS